MEKLNRNKVRSHSIRRLLWFIHHPDTQFENEIWWCLQKDWQQPASARKIPKIPLGLLKKASITNPNTGREVGIYYISKTDFNKIKNFWIQNYFITDIYNVTKEIQKITKDIKTNIGSYFDELLNDYYHHFVIYKDKETSSKTSHLVYWLNFIVQIFDKIKIPRDSKYYKCGFEYKYRIKRLEDKDSNWRWLRNKLIHFFDENIINYKWWVECDEKKFKVTIEENSKQDQLIFLWENFHKFLIQALNKIKKELIKGISV